MQKRKKQALKKIKSLDQARWLGWNKGFLKYKLYEYQHVIHEDIWGAIRNEECLKYTLNCSRRWGKSFVLCLVAIEMCRRKEGAQVRFAAPTAKALRNIILPMFKAILSDCPREFKPRFVRADNVWIFPNGSEVHLAGTNNQHYESLRGTASDLNLIDEAGFATDLNYVVSSVLVPQTLTTGGKTILASTPSPSPAHDFFAIAMECKEAGFYSEYTIYHNKTLSQKTIDLYAKESGGYDSSTFKREYLCQFVVDEKRQIVKEWKEEFEYDLEPSPFTPYYHRYVAMDIGVIDYTATLYATYDYLRATLYVEDEAELEEHEVTTEKIRCMVQEKEKATFKGIPPYRRIADNNNLILLQDLGSMHDLHFSPTSKDSLHAMVNELRIFVQQGRLVVSPKCSKLIACLKYGIWDKRRKDFERSTVYKHFDHLAALVYLVRNLDQQTNPIPADYGKAPHTHYMPGLSQGLSSEQEQLKNLILRRRA